MMRLLAAGINPFASRDIMYQIVIPQGWPPGILPGTFLVAGVIDGKPQILFQRVFVGILKSLHDSFLPSLFSIPLLQHLSI